MSTTLSVVLPNHNDADRLPAAVDAILSQSRPPAELVLVDDGSTDGSRDVIQALAAEHAAVKPVWRDDRGGVAAAVTSGLAEATGDWFYGAAADDAVLPGFFEAALGVADTHPSLGAVFGALWCDFDDHRGSELQVLPGAGGEAAEVMNAAGVGAWFDSIEAGWSVSTSTLLRREAVDAAGGFRKRLGPCADLYLNRAVSLRHGAAYLPRPCARVRIHADSYSAGAMADPERMRGWGDAMASLFEAEVGVDRERVRRWRLKWELELCGGFEALSDTVLPRRLRDVRRAYAALGTGGNALDRALSKPLRAVLQRVDRRRARGQKNTQAHRDPEEHGG